MVLNHCAVAVRGLTDPSACLLDKAFYTVAGAGVLIPSLLEAPVTGLYNFANNASIAGQYVARADLQADPSDATIEMLSAVVYGSQAAGGLLGAAAIVPEVVKFGPRVNTPDELAAGANGGVGAAEDLLAAANKPYNASSEQSVLSRAWDKHSGRPGGTLEPLKGNAVEKNTASEAYLRDLLNNSNTTRIDLSRGGFEHRLPNGQGVRFNADGSFNTLLDPRKP